MHIETTKHIQYIHTYRQTDRQKDRQTEVKFQNEKEFIKKIGDYKYCWNVSIKTGTKLPYSKPDILIWDKKKAKSCSVIKISCPADASTTRKTNETLQKYGPLLKNLQMMYNDYKFEIIPIIIGAFDFVPNNLKTSLGNLNFDKKEIRKSKIRKLQTITVLGIVNIVKTFISCKM